MFMSWRLPSEVETSVGQSFLGLPAMNLVFGTLFLSHFEPCASQQYTSRTPRNLPVHACKQSCHKIQASEETASKLCVPGVVMQENACS